MPQNATKFSICIKCIRLIVQGMTVNTLINNTHKPNEYWASTTNKISKIMRSARILLRRNPGK